MSSLKYLKDCIYLFIYLFAYLLICSIKFPVQSSFEKQKHNNTKLKKINENFSLGPAPRIFAKLLKIPKVILRRINIRIIVYMSYAPICNNCANLQ